MQQTADGERPPIRNRVAGILDRAETIYLKLLRAIILIIATSLILYAAILAVVSLYRVAQSPDSVQEQVAEVAPQELTQQDPAATVGKQGDEGKPRVDPIQRRTYDQIVGQYHQLFQSRFEPFRQSEDKKLSRAEFDDNFVGTQQRLQAISQGDLNFDNDVADLRDLVSVMSGAAQLPQTQQSLARYKAAKKVRVCRNVEKTRTETRNGWDRFSTSCPNWFYEPIGCRTTRQVEVPYTARECTMKFPEGTQSHTQLFRAYQDRFYTLLSERRQSHAAEAAAARSSIVEGIARGKLDLWTALSLAGAFLLLMFFFLLIAIERHQRRLSTDLGS